MVIFLYNLYSFVWIQHVFCFGSQQQCYKESVVYNLTSLQGGWGSDPQPLESKSDAIPTKQLKPVNSPHFMKYQHYYPFKVNDGIIYFS